MSDQALPQVIRILKASDIEFVTIGIEDRCRFSDADVFTTLLVQVDETNPNPKNWKAAAEEIYQHLQQSQLDCSALQVELLIPSRCCPKTLSSDSPSSEAIAAFDLIKDQLTGLVFGLPNLGLAFGLYMVSQTPTIVIFLQDGSSYDWAQFSTACQSIASAHKLAVQLQPARLSITANKIQPKGLGPSSLWGRTYFARTAGSGASISVQEEPTRSGTLSLHIVLESADPKIKKKLCILMNHHVVQPIDPVLAEAVYVNGGIDAAFLRRHQIKLPVQSPGAGDSQILRIRSRALGEVIWTSGIRRSCISLNQPSLNKLSCENSSCSNSHIRMDWAVAEVPARAFSTNKAPPKSVLGLKDFDNYRCGDHSLITKLAEPVRGLRVFKAGRTSGITSGVVMRTRLIITSQEFPMKTCSFISEERQIFPEDHHPYFSQSGDSGSCVLDANGNAIGLLFGYISPGEKQEISLMTDMKMVFADIEKQTGCKVRLAEEKDRSWSAVWRDVAARAVGVRGG
ncbi:hypothetical protein MMC30_008877 [Trapelia coarctata]|nr:hypothetical protein [Trapelia coarctata]